ncbi:MAG TPA: ABC transporter ATP-binding protein [Polyangiales bacterium]|jgi:NitT/TauT family transport system ATP-binding protein|nr:ABC transporter ATP-binding protein [Polyangiales bacterium]
METELVQEVSMLPSYREQTPDVADRFKRIYERPIVLDVQNLGRQFSSDSGYVAALENVSFQAHRREFICIIGASGCGKSTLIRILAGLDQQSSGEMLLDGKPVHGPGPDRGMVFQGYTLFPWRTVLENVMFGLEMRGLRRTAAEHEALEWVEIVGLRRFVNSYPHELSGGMKQRVAIARALANRPRILFMDEPFAALDAQTRAQMQSYLIQLWKQIDITIVFVTHDLEEAVYLSDRILVLGAHPGHVREVVEVALPRPRERTQMVSPLFLATKKHLESLIHGSPAMDAEETPMPTIRMTQAGDEVE